jgi:hypothetical protein
MAHPPTSAEASPVRPVPLIHRAGATRACGRLHRVRTRGTRRCARSCAHGGRAGGCGGHRAGLHGAVDPLSRARAPTSCACCCIVSPATAWRIAAARRNRDRTCHWPSMMAATSPPARRPIHCARPSPGRCCPCCGEPVQTARARARGSLLNRITGMSYTQIARHCGITAKTVEKHIARALRACARSWDRIRCTRRGYRMSRLRHTEDASLFARASAWVARLEAPDCTRRARRSKTGWLKTLPMSKPGRRPKIFSSRARAWLRTHGCARRPRAWRGLPTPLAAWPGRGRWHLPGHRRGLDGSGGWQPSPAALPMTHPRRSS